MPAEFLQDAESENRFLCGMVKDVQAYEAQEKFVFHGTIYRLSITASDSTTS
jgi:hypothetical protein